ncbi:MAG TPA: hypothetical protein VMV10_08845 [Pirellulales bacterium]|nr:hypothetical protein [Pirellulales bacterium]
MIHSNIFADRVQVVFRPTERGVVGLVDDLLGLCRLYQLRINFRDDRCCVRHLGADAQESFEIPVPKSVFRAALARTAAICNEQHPESVTPYRGEGTIAVLPPVSSCSEKGVAPSTCYVSFINTPRDQHFEMRFSTISAGDRNRFTVLLRDKRTVTVFGHALKYVENAANTTDCGSYGILSRTGGGEVLVALFRASEVIGVFSGDMTDPDAPGLAGPSTSAV